MSKAKTNQETEITEMLSGFQSTLPSTVKTIAVLGKNLTPAQVETQLQSFLTAITAITTAHATYTLAVANRKALDPGIKGLMLALRGLVKQLFPGDAVTQAKFGVTLKPRAKANSLKKATSAAKANATKEKNKPSASKPESQVLLFGANGQPLNAPASMTPVSPASAAPESAAPAAGSSVSGK